MPEVRLLDSSTGIQQILDEIWSSSLPEARQLAATIMKGAGLDELYGPSNSQTLIEGALCPEVGDGSVLQPGPFFRALEDCAARLEQSTDPAVVEFLAKEVRPLLENRDLFGAYSGLMIGG